MEESMVLLIRVSLETVAVERSFRERACLRSFGANGGDGQSFSHPEASTVSIWYCTAPVGPP